MKLVYSSIALSFATIASAKDTPKVNGVYTGNRQVGQPNPVDNQPNHLNDHLSYSIQQSDKPCHVQVKLENKADKPFYFVTVDTPFSDTIEGNFFDIDNGADFAGLIAEHGGPLKVEDVVLLDAKSEITNEVDLCEFTSFPTNDKYTVSGWVDVMVLDFHDKDQDALKEYLDTNNIEERDTIQVFMESSNAIKIQQDASSPSNPMQRNAAGTPQVARESSNNRSLRSNSLTIYHNGCSSTQVNHIFNGLRKGIEITTDALTELPGGSYYGNYVDDLYYWFNSGTYSQNYNLAVAYKRILNAMRGTSLATYYCSPRQCGSSTYAYVYPNHNAIYLCPAYFTASPNAYKFDSQGGILVHEYSHLHSIYSTNDYAYGTSGARNLARNDKYKARKNADNFEYFAETYTLSDAGL